jgi:RNA polymerase sigma factor (sigma-70 family)
VPLSAALLRVRSDEQLVSLFRAGSDDAFSVIHERYHARLLAYARQMLRSSGGDAEDALQDVFVRAFKSLRASNRPVLLRAWLYRIAHNRCIDELRRPIPVPTQLESDARPTLASGATQDPSAVAERSEAVALLVADVRTLPVPQRSALLMRELQGLSYQELAVTLGVSVPAVKSLLLRARTGLVDLKVARDTPCTEIRLELADAADRGVRMNARSRRHVRECHDCHAFHRRQRDLHKHLAALLPVGPLGKLLGLFGFGGSGGAGGGAAPPGGPHPPRGAGGMGRAPRPRRPRDGRRRRGWKRRRRRRRDRGTDRGEGRGGRRNSRGDRYSRRCRGPGCQRTAGPAALGATAGGRRSAHTDHGGDRCAVGAGRADRCSEQLGRHDWLAERTDPAGRSRRHG